MLTSYLAVMSNGEAFSKLSHRERAIFTPSNSVVPTEWATDCFWENFMQLEEHDKTFRDKTHLNAIASQTW